MGISSVDVWNTEQGAHPSFNRPQLKKWNVCRTQFEPYGRLTVKCCRSNLLPLFFRYECNNSIIVNAILICDSRLQSAQNKRKTYQYTQWSIDTMSCREKPSNQLFLFPVEKLKSQLLASHSLLGSVHPLRFVINAYEPKIINEFTMKKKISSQLVVQLFFFALLLASFNGFVWIYSSIFFRNALRFVCITI